MMRALCWISVVFLPLGLIPVGWMTTLAAGFCGADCEPFPMATIGALIAACVAVLFVWLLLLVAMIRGRATRRVARLAGAADALLLLLAFFSLWTFGGV